MKLMVNQLSKETSPYLQQHADNPVHWLPYSQEAFAKAKQENKVLFISIGYSSCHWCHVMARESFEDEETAKYLNEHFISVKIDREEYPGIDKAYQEAYQLVNRRGGGWPLTVFALPDGAPFVLATYLPKDTSHRYGLKSFRSVMEDVVNVWTNNRQQCVEQANAIMDGFVQYSNYLTKMSENVELDDNVFQEQLQALFQRFDSVYGGFGPAPKFPRVSTLRFLLQEGVAREDKGLVEFVRFTYHKMAMGGIYDQLGGGFARYSVDEKWLVPHFEKMLYDNAGLLLLGADIYAANNDNYSKWVVYDTVSWVAREMRSKFGAFYSTLNAESEGQEGKFYVWQKDELQKILKDNFKYAEMRYGITKSGNFDDPHHPEIKGMNILSVVMSIGEIAKKTKKSEQEIVTILNDIRQTLFAERAKRIPPSRDTKIITSWNALMVISLFRVAEVFDLEDAGKLAISALKFITEYLVKDDMVIHSYHETGKEQTYREIEGVLDDYSVLISALISAFEFTDNWEYMELASKLEKTAKKLFYVKEENAYYVNPIKKETLFDKVLQVSDESMVSGFAVMVNNLFKLGKYLENNKLIERGQLICDRYAGSFGDYPGSMNGFMLGATNYIRYPTEIVLIDTEGELDRSYQTAYIPNRLIYRYNENNKNDGRPEWEVVKNRITVEKPTVFICKGMTCSLPLTQAKDVVKELTENRD